MAPVKFTIQPDHIQGTDTTRGMIKQGVKRGGARPPSDLKCRKHQNSEVQNKKGEAKRAGISLFH